MYHKNNWETTFPLDKKRKKDYTESSRVRMQLSAFDDDAVADSAVDYLYAPSNQSKTQGFLKCNGFPTVGDRQWNRQLYGAAEEQKQVRDLLKSKTNSILNPVLPNANDRAFLHGLMGDKDGEREYQNQLTSASRAQSDFLNTFRGTPFESGLRSAIPISDAPGRTRHINADTQNASVTIERSDAIVSPGKFDIAQQPGKLMPPSGLQNREYGNKGFWYIPSTDNSNPPNNPKDTNKPMTTSNSEKTNNSESSDILENKAKLSASNTMLEEHIHKNYAGKKTVTIAIRRPVENSREVAKIKDGKLDNGHAFIRIDDGQGKVEYVGYTPKKGDLAGMVTGAYVDGKYIDNSNEDWNVAKTYVLTDAQYMNAANYIKQVKSANTQNDYNIEKNNCVNFALNVLAHAGQSVGTMMPVEEHSWTLPDNIEEQLADYSALPSELPPELAALVVKTMGRYYGYTPSDAAQDLKFASGGVLLNFDGSNGIVTYNGGPRFTD